MRLLRFLLGLVLISLASGQKCTKSLSVDLTGASFDRNTKTYIHEGISYPPERYRSIAGRIRGCVCQVRTCVKSCCPDGQSKINHTCRDHDWDLQVDVYEDETLLQKNADVYVISRVHQCKGIVLYPHTGSSDQFFIQKSGQLFSPGDSMYDIDDYCLSKFTEASNVTQAHICDTSLKKEPQSLRIVNVVGMIISIPFLLVTLIIYSLLPDKRNIGTRCQMCYVLSLTSAYFFLVFIQLSRSLDKLPCITLATICHFSFMSSFCWMNISCIDIYWTFSGRSGFAHGFIKKSAQFKKFSFYCIYAYGFPLVLISIILGINSLEDEYLWYHPNFGMAQCWIKEGYPLLIYFYGPMGILIVANITLFVLTALRIRQLERDVAMVRKDESMKHYEKDKQRFVVYFKLLIALGINWSLEFLSWVIDWMLEDKKIPEIWYLPDLCNALYGVLIFYLFVCKRYIWISLQKRYYVFMGQPQKAHALSTRTSNYQTTDTEKTTMDDTVNSTKV